VATDRNRIRELLARPSESLNVEIKRWFDPDQEIGAAKIVKAVFALRNRNGGVLILGFDNKTLEPNDANRPADVHASFHVDKIQGLISRFASEPFEVGIVVETVNGREHVADAAEYRGLVQSRISQHRSQRLLVPFWSPDLHHSGGPAGAQGRWLIARRPIARWSPVDSNHPAVHRRRHRRPAQARIADLNF